MPIEKTIHINSDTFIAIWNIKEDTAELIKLLKPNTKDHATLTSFRLDRRKHEFLAVRQIIKQCLNIYPEIEYSISGKPSLKNSDYNISITHTKDYAAVAFSKNNTPGIDIEYPSERILKIWERFISPQEQDFIPTKEKTQYYSLIWCIKEALFKIIDKEGILFNKDIICKPFNINKQENIAYCLYKKKEFKFSYLITPNYNLVYSL